MAPANVAWPCFGPLASAAYQFGPDVQQFRLYFQPFWHPELKKVDPKGHRLKIHTTNKHIHTVIREFIDNGVMPC